MYKIITFYKFAALTDPESMRARIAAFCADHHIKGTILLANEGINSTIAGLPEQVDAVVEFLRSFAPLADLEYKASFDAVLPFRRLKVKVKPEIVTLKSPVDPTNLVGRYVTPKQWNDLIAQDDVVIVDTRNHYEFEVGTFEGAVDPKTDHFSQFPNFVEKELADKKDRPIAMFCTGGIRCEKATSYLLQQGFKNVFHLQGGILKYLEEIPQEQSKWQGDCFIFDDRRALEHGLKAKK